MQGIADAQDEDALAGALVAVDEDLVAAVQHRLHRIPFDADGGKIRTLQPHLAQPAAREAEAVEGNFLRPNRARAGRCIERKPRNCEEFLHRCSPPGTPSLRGMRGVWWAAQFILRNPEEFGQPPTVVLLQATGRSLADELLEVARVAAEHGGERSEAGTAGLRQFEQAGAFGRGVVMNFDQQLFLGTSSNPTSTFPIP